jgi:bacterioferritin-associated ferredoxin
MYVCVCNAVTEHEIEQAVRDGARSLVQLEESLLIGTCCGKCRGKAQECLARFAPQRPTLVQSA